MTILESIKNFTSSDSFKYIVVIIVVVVVFFLLRYYYPMEGFLNFFNLQTHNYNVEENDIVYQESNQQTINDLDDCGMAPFPELVNEESYLLSKAKELSAEDLLPRLPNGQIVQLDSNYLTSGVQVGIDTRGSTMKNPTLDIRGQIPIQKTDTSNCPLTQITNYEQDLYSKRLVSQ